MAAAKKKSTPIPAADDTLIEDALKFLEYNAVEDGWFQHARGWGLINRMRAALGRPRIGPADEPTADYFNSDGGVK